MIPWSRPEPFCAWVRLDDQHLIVVDHALAARLGVQAGDSQIVSTEPAPLEVHLAVNARCFAPCTDCYLDARPDGAEPSFAVLRERITQARARGASTIAFGGGEPLLREDLGELASYARSIGLVPAMTTSGLGLTEERAKGLLAFGQINVSHDGVDGGYAAVRGFDGERAAERAIGILSRAGIAVGVNLVLTRQSFVFLEKTAGRVADLGAGELQLLRFKPRGRAARLEYLDRRLSKSQIEALFPVISSIVTERRLSVRIDCALVPLLGEPLSALPDAAQFLSSLGIFGCEAGRHLGALDVSGAEAPCSFSSSSAEELRRFRSYHKSPPEPCASCSLYSVCRGGCQVVSRYENADTFGPDPECPRVLRYRAEAKP